LPKGGFYSYEAKYLSADEAKLVVPVPLSAPQERQVRELAVEVFRVLELYGMARVDFFLRPDGQWLVNEPNTLPGFTPISMYPKLWEATGLAYADLLATQIDLALERHRQRQALNRQMALPGA